MIIVYYLARRARRITSVCVLAIAIASPSSAQIFTNRAAFEAAAGAVLVETFENVPVIGNPAGGSVPSLTLPFFSLASTPTAIKVLSYESYGARNTTPGGYRYLYLDTDVGDHGSITTFTFSSPIFVLGFDYTALYSSIIPFALDISHSTFNLTPNALGSEPRFWGYISSTPFSSFTLDSQTASGYGMDQLTFTTIPEPTVFSLLGFAAIIRKAILRRTRTKY